MRPAPTVVAVVVALFGCGAALAQQAPRERPIRVLLIGDSISIGYTEHVRTSLGDGAVVVRPIRPDGSPENCEGTSLGVENLARWLALDGGAWDVIHFNFGLHDLKHVDPKTGANSNDPDDPRQADPERYRRQLETITAQVVATGARAVFATTTPVPDGVRPYRAPADVALYNAIAREIMDAHGVAIDDLFAVVAPRLGELQQQANVHFTPEGSQVLGDAVTAAIRTAAELAPSSH